MMILWESIESKSIESVAKSEEETSPAHHIEQVGQLQETAHIWVDLDRQVLQLLFCWIDAQHPVGQNLGEVKGSWIDLSTLPRSLVDTRPLFLWSNWLKAACKLGSCYCSICLLFQILLLRVPGILECIPLLGSFHCCSFLKPEKLEHGAHPATHWGTGQDIALGQQILGPAGNFQAFLLWPPHRCREHLFKFYFAKMKGPSSPLPPATYVKLGKKRVYIIESI